MSSRLNIGSSVSGVSFGQIANAKPLIRVANDVSLESGRIHEVEGAGAIGVALAAAGAVSGLILWVGEERVVRSIRVRGIASFFDPSRLITVQTANRRETLWAAEEALRCRGAGLVVVQLALGPDLFESRRLQVASQGGGSLGLILISRRAQSSAAQSRWHCDQSDGHWLWSQTKNRRGKLKTWSVRCTRPPQTSLPPDLRPPVPLSQPLSSNDFTSATDSVFATLSTAPLSLVPNTALGPVAQA